MSVLLQNKSPKPVGNSRRHSAWPYWLCFALWWGAMAYFWLWWLRPEHNIGTSRYVLISLCILWLHFTMTYFMSFLLNGARPHLVPIMQGPLRVAMVTTKTPAEPLSVLQTTLLAMLEQTPAHDTWLADEDPDDETIAWCKAHGVFISTRKGVSAYHQKEWPRRTRCKEGNLAYFYDHYGYARYDVVSQLDADHAPEPGYLEAILRGFEDPRVGYVSAPSICDSNANGSWAARMRLYAEAPFHGGIQVGYSNGWAPMCIGSHYAVRTRALQEVGGLGPELAEDHSTTMILNSGGWRGAHAANAIAHGGGPACLTDLIVQEFQWSRSLTTLLLSHTPRYLKGLTPRLRFQFLLCQAWYPVFSLFMAAMYLFPILALAFDIRYVGVSFPEFFVHAIPATLVVVGFVYLMRRQGYLRPFDAKVLSWERTLFACAQWPWVLLGCSMAVLDKVRGSFVDFRVTPKGDVGPPPLPTHVLLPYVILALGAVVPILLATDLSQSAGFVLFSLANALIYTLLLAVIVVKHGRENNIRWVQQPVRALTQMGVVASLVMAMLLSLNTHGARSVFALSYGTDVISLAEPQVKVAGAGTGKAGAVVYRINVGSEWLAPFKEMVE
ncbi:glycosyltransferase family 2 protein [Aliiroseovarius lamellibrachiae]|uniref:glycosyltransferase family 2 protein n=1 Tax=Aliiroseovarius lamellibrachiae TaxID=1924933 RepID=UPI001BE0C555|nr:glycosyltransferase family 2 protein [Aliiroseovarius lamellibrachiae]MBT2130605.1 glycosyltransferase [Aliiroseovarius lamellibrachiae]